MVNGYYYNEHVIIYKVNRAESLLTEEIIVYNQACLIVNKSVANMQSQLRCGLGYIPSLQFNQGDLNR